MSDDQSEQACNVVADYLHDEQCMLIDYLKSRFGKNRGLALAVLRSVAFDCEAIVRSDFLETLSKARKYEDVKNG